MIFFVKKMVQNIYFYLNYNWFDILNNRYKYINNQTIIRFLAKTKKTNLFKT